MKSRLYKPPKVAEFILNFVSANEVNFSVAGDLEEEYNEIRRDRGNVSAIGWYFRQVAKASMPFINHSFRRSTGMFKNYLKTTLRNMKRNKITSFINIAGLSIGISFALLVYLFVEDEYSYDRFHQNADSIYRVYRYSFRPEYGERFSGSTPIRIADDFKRLYPEIENIVRISDYDMIVKRGESVFQEVMIFVDPDFFKAFSFPVIAGNTNAISTDINSIAISQEMADKYFPGEDPVGKTMELNIRNNDFIFTVAAVLDNCSDRSTIMFDFLASYDKFMSSMSGFMTTSYRANNPSLFLKLLDNTDVENLKKNMLTIGDHIDQKLGEGQINDYHLENIKTIHLNTQIGSDHLRTSDPIYSQILAGLGGIVLFIACVNFMTLSIGLSKRRFREVGMRKVMGAFRSMLMKQFLSETIVSSLFALILGIGLTILFIPLFNLLSNKSLVFHLDLLFIAFMFILTFLIGLVSGFYPSFLQSRYNPVNVLKGTHRKGGKNYFSRGLIVVQFSLMIVLIIITVVFQMQLNFMTEKDLGFEYERLLELNLYTTEDDAVQKFERFSSTVNNDNRIISISAASSNYGLTWGKTIFWTRLAFKDEQGNRNFIHFNQVGYDYLRTMGIELVEGRDFSREFGSDWSDAVIINESAVREFNLEEPIGKNIPWMGKANQTVIGVMKDFHYGSLHGEIKPLLFALSCDPIDTEKFDGLYGFWPHVYGYAQIKIASGDPRPVIDMINSIWKEVSPNSPFDLVFVDDTIQTKYESEKKWGEIVRNSSFFAVLIASLGLFGLSLITVQERIKEVGIRKVLGASAGRIVNLVSRDMIYLVIISSIIAWPAAYVITSRWLQNFAYKIDLNAMIFIVSGLIALIIASVTISFQTIRAAYTNPVDTLRYE
ncbi:MAG: FtsX-like permease family protein [bacterium]|nr:FtsX-like permease family protein [bacterium]